MKGDILRHVFASALLLGSGLRVSAQEAALITLIEPLLNPVWAYLITPAKDTPNVWMFTGGALILVALLWRYLPAKRLTREAASG